MNVEDDIKELLNSIGIQDITEISFNINENYGVKLKCTILPLTMYQLLSASDFTLSSEEKALFKNKDNLLNIYQKSFSKIKENIENNPHRNLEEEEFDRRSNTYNELIVYQYSNFYDENGCLELSYVSFLYEELDKAAHIAIEEHAKKIIKTMLFNLYLDKIESIAAEKMIFLENRESQLKNVLFKQNISIQSIINQLVANK